MEKLNKKIKIQTSINLITGLHIGGSGENVEIGGIDSPVIKIATKDNQPYIPGSSLKGKMRSLLEQTAGAVKVGDNAEINNLFGFANNNMPSKIIVRDSFLTEDSVTILQASDNLDMPYTEGKWENVIDRVKGTAGHPRQTERVPAGVTFNVEFVINVWDNDGDGTALLSMLDKGIKLLENDYIGGSGSRGYGQIAFGPMRKFELSENTNWQEKEL